MAESTPTPAAGSRKVLWSLPFFVFSPTVFLCLEAKHNLSGALRTLVDQTLLVSLLSLLLFTVETRAPLRLLRFFVVSIAALYYFLLLFSVIYWHETGFQLDILYIADEWQDVPRTLYSTYHWKLFVILALLLGSFAFLFELFRRLACTLRSLRDELFAGKRLVVPWVLGLASLFLSPPQDRPVIDQIVNCVNMLKSRNAIPPVFPDNSHLQTEAEENIVVLQLESGNAMVLNGEVEFNGRRYDGQYMPNLMRMAQDGVYFPHVWSPGVQTNRSLVGTMCGVTNDLGRALSFTPARIRSKCLPEILKEGGYRTIYFEGFDDPGYMNLEEAVPAMGFNELHGKDIMNGNYGSADWGFDDCVFYDNIFRFLREKYPNPSKLFLYLEVSFHHYPFNGSEKYAFTHAFKNPQLYIESYINSAMEQDYCVAKFYELYRAYFQGHAHLFVHPDHSVPVGLRGGIVNVQHTDNSNFLVPLVYLPPQGDKSRYKIGERLTKIPSLTDLMPSIMELLNGKNYQNSFVPYMQRSPGMYSYEDCQILAQPYGDEEKIILLRYPEKYIYYATNKKLEHYNLELDWLEHDPEIVSNHLSFKDFKKQYWCRRYEADS